MASLVRFVGKGKYFLSNSLQKKKELDLSTNLFQAATKFSMVLRSLQLAIIDKIQNFKFQIKISISNSRRP